MWLRSLIKRGPELALPVFAATLVVSVALIVFIAYRTFLSERPDPLAGKTKAEKARLFGEAFTHYHGAQPSGGGMGMPPKRQ